MDGRKEEVEQEKKKGGSERVCARVTPHHHHLGRETVLTAGSGYPFLFCSLLLPRDFSLGVGCCCSLHTTWYKLLRATNCVKVV